MVLLLLLLLVARAIRKNDLESENKGLFSAAFGTGIKVNPGYRLPGDNHIPEKMKIRPFQRSALLCFAFTAEGYTIYIQQDIGSNETL